MLLLFVVCVFRWLLSVMFFCNFFAFLFFTLVFSLFLVFLTVMRVL